VTSVSSVNTNRVSERAFLRLSSCVNRDVAVRKKFALTVGLVLAEELSEERPKEKKPINS
jgi:hypothetical protein